MIDFPRNLTNGLFDTKLTRGCVIRTLFRAHDDKDRYKYFIILNNDLSNDTIIFVLTTSRVDFYDKHPYFNPDIVRIPSQAIDFFQKETIINCREVFKISKETMKANFQKNRLEFIGVLPSEIVKDVDTIIKRSFYISAKDKKLILGEERI